jgi:hypothetical protein
MQGSAGGAAAAEPPNTPTPHVLIPSGAQSQFGWVRFLGHVLRGYVHTSFFLGHLTCQVRFGLEYLRRAMVKVLYGLEIEIRKRRSRGFDKSEQMRRNVAYFDSSETQTQLVSIASK